MFRRISFYLLMSCASILLVSCASVQEHTTVEPSGWQAEQQRRQQIKNWEIRGRLGVQTEVTGGNVDIIWKQSAQDYSIRLIAALGTGNYHIKGDDVAAVVHYPGGQVKTIYNTDDIFTSVLEIDLPVSAVKDWIRGLPARSMIIDDIQWNDQGLLHSVKQSGWNVEIKRYTGGKLLLPHIIYLSRNDNDDLDIRLALKQWLVKP